MRGNGAINFVRSKKRISAEDTTMNEETFVRDTQRRSPETSDRVSDDHVAIPSIPSSSRATAQKSERQWKILSLKARPKLNPIHIENENTANVLR